MGAYTSASGVSPIHHGVANEVAVDVVEPHRSWPVEVRDALVQRPLRRQAVPGLLGGGHVQERLRGVAGRGEVFVSPGGNDGRQGQSEEQSAGHRDVAASSWSVHHSVSLHDREDVLGNQAVRLTVDACGSIDVRGVDEAEHLSVALVDPVAQVSDPVLFLRLQVGQMGLANVSDCNPTIDGVHVHE